jgi:hypothetical protein
MFWWFYNQMDEPNKHCKYSRRALCVTASSVGGYRVSPAGGHEDGMALITSDRTGSSLVAAL